MLPWLLTHQPAFAQQNSLSPASFDVNLDEEDDTALFVVGNTLFAVYHELGHALIDLLDLPVIGREEDAADGFAAVMMIPPDPDHLRDELIVAVADGWRLQSEEIATLADQGPLWGEHALDEQRYFAIICWMVGSDQEGFFDLARESGMPLSRIKACAGDFERMKTGWQDLLAPSNVDQSRPKPAGAGQIAIVYEEPMTKDVPALAWAKAGRVIEQAVLDLSNRIDLPKDITVRFRSCGDANAFWQGDRLEVLMCYGLVGDFLAVLEGHPEG